MNITVTIEAPELVGALNNLASAFGNNPLAGVTQSDIVKPLETAAPKEESPEVATKTMYFLHEGSDSPIVVKKGEPLDFLRNDIFDPITKAEYDKLTKEAEPEPEKTEPVKEEPKEEKNTSGITLDVLTTKTREFVQGNTANRKKLKGFLEEKGVPKVSELDPADYQAAVHFMDSNA